jgi:heme exporter protein CcmD
VSEFFAMSGYAAYVWPSLALGIGTLLLNVWLARRAVTQAEQDARRRIAMARQESMENSK